MKTDGTGQKNQFAVGRLWEKPLDTSNRDVLEILNENATWWTHAALTVESTAAHFPSGEEKALELLLLGAVYRERADINARLIEQSRRLNRGDGIKSRASRLE
jgi:hypothetical protein